jgi:hypothetical protein
MNSGIDRAAVIEEIRRPSPSKDKTSSVVGITARPSRAKQMPIGMLIVVVLPLGSAIAWWMTLGALWIS